MTGTRRSRATGRLSAATLRPAGRASAGRALSFSFGWAREDRAPAAGFFGSGPFRGRSRSRRLASAATALSEAGLLGFPPGAGGRLFCVCAVLGLGFRGLCLGG